MEAVHTAFGHHQKPSRIAMVNLINKTETIKQGSDVKTLTLAK